MTVRYRRWLGNLGARNPQDLVRASPDAGIPAAGEVTLAQPDLDLLRPGPLRPSPFALAGSPDAQTALEAQGFEEARADYVAAEAVIPSSRLETLERRALPSLDEAWIGARTLRDQSLLRLMLAQDSIRVAVTEGAVVELRASTGDQRDSLLPVAAAVEINASDANAAQSAIRNLKSEWSVIFIHDALQFLTETRQFLGLCFSKLTVGGVMLISVPHQFLYERKLRLPSRRNRLHRRFYTPNTLLADVEEAIDPCEFRIRFLGDSDAGYALWEGLNADPEGGQDILLAIEKTVRPPWRPELDADEIWAETATKPVRYLPLDTDQPAQIRVISPDSQGIDRVIVLKLDHRGDFLLATEAFKSLRQAFGSAELSLVCGSWNAADAKQSGFFDEVIPFDFFPEDDSARQERPSSETLIRGFARQMDGRAYDLAIDLRLYDDTRTILQVIEARNRAGFDRYDLFPWLTIRLDTPSATVDDRAETGVMTAARFHTSRGAHRTYEIAFEKSFWPTETRTIVWGPYQELKPGRYQLECLIEPLDEDFKILFDIVKDSGSRTVTAGLMQIERGRRPRLDLQVDERIPEF